MIAIVRAVAALKNVAEAIEVWALFAKKVIVSLEVRAMVQQMIFLEMNGVGNGEKRKQSEKSEDVCAVSKEQNDLKMVTVTNLLVKAAVTIVVVILGLILTEVEANLKVPFQGLVAPEDLVVSAVETKTRTTTTGKELMSGFLKATLSGA